MLKLLARHQRLLQLLIGVLGHDVLLNLVSISCIEPNVAHVY